MKWRMVAASSLVLVVGMVAWSSLRQSEAQGQVGQDKHGWEYKVMKFQVEDDRENVGKQTEVINSLAADGWEYVGLLCAGANPYSMQNGNFRSRYGTESTSCGHVLFKRAKR
jgi:hypothetical protein